MTPLPEGDRFSDVLKFRRLGTGGGDQLYECWGAAVRAYAAAAVSAERERIADICMRAADRLWIEWDAKADQLDQGKAIALEELAAMLTKKEEAT